MSCLIAWYPWADRSGRLGNPETYGLVLSRPARCAAVGMDECSGEIVKELLTLPAPRIRLYSVYSLGSDLF